MSTRTAAAPLTDLNVVNEIVRARARQTRLSQLAFVLTWATFIGLLVGALVAAHKIDPEFLAKWSPFILGGIPVTLYITVTSVVLAVAFAAVGALASISTITPIYALAMLYTSLVRGTPFVVQLLFFYLALPQIAPWTAEIPAFVIGVFALAFCHGAYLTEIFRAGIQAIPRGQLEAAAALAMPRSHIMRRIIFPQAIRIVIPAIGNQFISMIKDSALVSLITVQELLWRAQKVGQNNFRSLESLLVAALVYWLLTIAFSWVQHRLEVRMAESDRPT
jgi:polar amino acid transport system permease protein